MAGQAIVILLIITFAPPFLSGIFTLVSAMLQVKLKNVPISRTTISPPAGGARFVNLGDVLLHAGIVLLVVTIAFSVVFVTANFFKVSGNLFLPLFFLFRWVPYVLAFVWVAAKVERVIRWKHLIYVAIVVAIIIMPIHSIYTAIYTMIARTSIAPDTAAFEIFYTCYTWVQVFASMGAGGAITNAMKSR